MPADDFVEVTVVDAWDESPTLRGVALDLGPLAAQHRAPGQVVKLRGTAGEGYFALANSPAAMGSLPATLAGLRPEEGRGTGTICRSEILLRRGGNVADEMIARATPGARLPVSAPFGKGFPVAEARGRDLLLFAAGSGISPIRALVQHVVAERAAFGRAVLFYGERRDADFAFTHEHAAWAEAGVEVVLCSSQPSPAWTGARGYVQDVAQSIAFASVDAGGAVAFLCGMKGMVSAVRDGLAAAGLPQERTYLNY